MKATRFFLLTALAGSLFMVSCQKEESPEVMSEEEAVEVIESAMSADAQGIAGEAADVAKAADTYAQESLCGSSGDSTLNYSITKPNLTASYSVAWNWELVCQGPIPQALLFGRTIQGSYVTNRMESDDSGTSDWSVTSLIAGDAYIVNGNYTRTGWQQSKIGQQNDFSSTLNADVTDLEVDKATQEVVGGLASFTLSASSSGGQTASYSGTIEFLGNQSATLTVNGNTYTLNW